MSFSFSRQLNIIFLFTKIFVYKQLQKTMTIFQYVTHKVALLCKFIEWGAQSRNLTAVLFCFFNKFYEHTALVSPISSFGW